MKISRFSLRFKRDKTKTVLIRPRTYRKELLFNGAFVLFNVLFVLQIKE